MQSPFKIFRRYQKGLLAFLAVMAMIAFGVGDQLSKILQTAGGSGASKPAVETNVGNVTQMALANLQRRRQTANRFVYRAMVTANPEIEKFAQFIGPSLYQRFGSDHPREVVVGWLLQHEADRLGIVVSNDRIEAQIRIWSQQLPGFLEGLTRSKKRALDSEQFAYILSEMQISARDLYDILREELKAQEAYRLLQPVSAQSPEQYWQYFQRMNTRQKIVVAPLPIRDFTAGIDTPPAATLQKFFEDQKNRFESAADGVREPGFKQPQKVKLQSLQLAELDIEALVARESPVTDKDIEEYYEAKKFIDRRLQIIDTAAPLDGASPISPEFAPDQKRPAAPSLPAEASPPAEPVPPCGGGTDEAEPVAGGTAAAEAQDKAADKPAVETPGDADAKKFPGVDDEKTDAEETPKPPARSPVRSIKYKPLADVLRDESLRREISDGILHERTVERMTETAKRMADAVRDVGFRFAQEAGPDLTGKSPAEKAREEQQRNAARADRSREELKKIAGKFDAKFSETPLVGARELSELPGLGKAQELGANEFARGGVRTTVDMVFMNENTFQVHEAESPAGSSRVLYAFWKVQDVPAHVPTLDETGVKDQVIEAYKLQRAIPKAQERAEKLAGLVRNSNEEFATVLSGQTVTGDASALSLLALESPEFSWFRESTVPAAGMGSQPIQLSRPTGVTAAGMKFMEFIFDKLGEGEVGVTLNDDASVCYLVKVLSRRPADQKAFETAELFKFSSPYSQLAQMEQQEVSQRFIKQLERTYAVKWSEAVETSAGPPADE